MASLSSDGIGRYMRNDTPLRQAELVRPLPDLPVIEV